MANLTDWEAPPRSRDDFEVAIVCALPREAEAVLAIWDGSYQDHGREYGKSDGDQNNYSTGRIGKHAVVIVWLDSIGKVSSAVAATNLLNSYRKIQLAVLVGVCGGCPKNSKGEDILLGDVVISTDVFQYDFKKQYQNGDELIDTCKYRKHNPAISAIINRLAARDGVKFTEDVARHVRDLEIKYGAFYQHPGPKKDVLFPSEYLHKHRKQKCATCDECETAACRGAREKSCVELGCDPNVQVNRARLEHIRKACKAKEGGEFSGPRVHFGVIGCGDTIIKSGYHRDEIAKQRPDIIAFEMESAGIFKSLTGVVIKSVCDYADSHKNKSWQDYAAGTAACAVKALLESYTPTDREIIDSDSHATVKLPRGLPASCYDRSPPPLKHRICVNFVHRTEIRRRMANTIFNKMPKDQQKRFLICGMAGSGKTQLCRWFASSYKDKFWGIFMIDASSTAAANRDFGTIAQWAGLRATGENGKEFLATSPDGWLLIVDNADREIVDDELFPRTDRGCVLITSRNTGVRYSHIDLNVNPMGTEDGITLFLLESKQDPTRDENRCLAKPLVEKLGCLPLAIKHAAVPVSKKRKTLGEVLEYYNKNMERLLRDSDNKGDDTYQYRTLYASIEMSLQTMTLHKDASSRGRAMEILQLCAFLHFRDVPEEVFHAAPSWKKSGFFTTVFQRLRPDLPLNQTATIPPDNRDFIVDRINITRGLACINYLPEWSHELQNRSRGDEDRAALSLLDSNGLGSFDVENHLFSMHPIVHEWNRSRLFNQDCQQARWSIGVALSNVIPQRGRGDSSSRQGELRRSLLSHVDFYLKSGNTMKSTGTNLPSRQVLTIEQVEAAEKFALVYEDNGNYHASRVLLQESVHAKSTLLGRKSLGTLNSLRRLSTVLERQGDFDKAAECSKEALEGFEALLGERSEKALESLGNYASSLNRLGRFLEAEKISRSCLETRQQLTMDTADTAEMKSNLAMAVLQQGKFDEAIDLLTQASKWYKTNFSDHNTETMRSFHNLAMAYRKAGEIKLAAEKGYEILELRKHMLGENHPDTLASKTELALAELKLGNREKAVTLSLESSAGFERCMGASSLSTLDSLSSLAAVKRNLCDYASAESLYRHVLDGYQQHFSQTHIDFLTTLANLAGVLNYCQRYDEAVQMYRQALDGFRAQLELNHPNVIQCQIYLAMVLAKLNDREGPEEAIDMYKELELRIGNLYPGHHYIKSQWLFTYSVFLQNQGNLAKAKEKVVEAMAGYKAKLGAKSVAVMNSIACFAHILDMEQKYEEAYKEYVKALDGYKELGGPMTVHHQACAERFADMQTKIATLNIPKPRQVQV